MDKVFTSAYLLVVDRGCGYDLMPRNITCVFESNVLSFYHFFLVYFKMVYIIKMKSLAQIQLIKIKIRESGTLFCWSGRRPEGYIFTACPKLLPLQIWTLINRQAQKITENTYIVTNVQRRPIYLHHVTTQSLINTDIYTLLR